MKAAQLDHYGKNFTFVVRDVEKPQATDNQVLIKVKEAAVNPLDSLVGTGFVRLMQNYRLPQTMGNELSGVVVAVGKNVTDFHVNDQVFTRLPMTEIGAFAEYVAVDADAIGPLPQSLDFASAAAAPLTGLTAYQGLREILHAHAGQTLFIPGGSGSFGQMAIPIAKDMGLTVIVSGGAAARERTMAAGADQYLDYKTDNYWELLTDIDLVIDTQGKTELEHEFSILKKGGQLLSLIAGPNGEFAKSLHMPLWKSLLFKMNGLQFDRMAKQHGAAYHFIFVRSDGAQVRELSQLIDRNAIMPAVDSKQFSLEQVNEAMAYLREGHPKGKVLIHFN